MSNLTVIIPSHNKGKYIAQCIHSVFAQTYQPAEVIVFDDKSTDDTLERLEELKKKYPALTVIASEENVGVSRARDGAIRAARTEYVTFIDADDFYYSQEKLEKEMQLAEQYYKEHGKYCCTYSQTVLTDAEGNRTDQLEIRNWDRFIRLGTVARMYKYWLPRDYCFPREVYLQVGGFDPKYTLYEDWDLNLRLFAAVDFRFSGSYGTAYRLDTGGLASVDHERHFRMKREVFRKNCRLLGCRWYETVLFYSFLYAAYGKGCLKNFGKKGRKK